MFRTTICLAVLLVLLGGTIPMQAQKAASAAATCSFTFESGAGSTFVKYCVSGNGNIIQLEVPAGHAHFLLSAEGYGVCNETPATAYWDYADNGESGNWGAASVVSQTASSVKIARTTGDGVWTLTQTFTLDPKTPGVKIVMALKNNTAAPRVAYLVRWGDIDPDSEVHANFGATRNAAVAWKFSTSGYGLMMQNSRTSQFGFTNGYARFLEDGPNPCDFAADASEQIIEGGHGSILLAYADTVGAKKTKTATIIYRGM
jgi:hypothetical protein